MKKWSNTAYKCLQHCKVLQGKKSLLLFFPGQVSEMTNYVDANIYEISILEKTYTTNKNKN